MTVLRTDYRGRTPVTHEFPSLLEADLAPLRGGNKHRLIARCWVATGYGVACGMSNDQYHQFRVAWEDQTFDKIHKTFDIYLPDEFRSKKPTA